MPLPHLPSREAHSHAAHDTSIPLWAEGAPGALGNKATDEPALSIHLPAPEVATGAGVIINPGGGYHILAADHEGLQVARFLNRYGIAAFVLRYRLQPDYNTKTALTDAQRAIRVVRARSHDFGVDPNRVGMMGFSAGGHLASMAGTHRDDSTDNGSDEISSQSARPDFLVLIYPAIDASLFSRGGDNFPATHTSVNADTPPTFLLSTHEDIIVAPEHSIRFYQALSKHGVQSELHIFGFGPHGTGLGTGDPHLNRWNILLIEWLTVSGFLASTGRIPLSGNITYNQSPLFWGWLTLLPEDPGLPVVSTYVQQMMGGRFEFTSDSGPVPGRYRVELRILADHFDTPREGHYTRNDEKVLTRQSPDSSGDYTIEVTPDNSTLSLTFSD